MEFTRVDVLILGILVLAGLIGGVFNYLTSKEKGARRIITEIITSTIACSLVPLLLSLLHSDLLENLFSSSPKKSGPYGFFGMCLVAAVSGRRFIQVVSERLMARIDELEKGINNSEKDIDSVKNAILDASSPSEVSEEGVGGAEGQVLAEIAKISKNENRKYLNRDRIINLLKGRVSNIEQLIEGLSNSGNLGSFKRGDEIVVYIKRNPH